MALAAAVAAVAAASYAIRLTVPLGVEVWRLALGQVPAWIAGFTLGVVGGERGWFDNLQRGTARTIRRIAWGGAAATVVFIGSAAITGTDIETFAGGGTWQSLVIAVLESVLVLTMPLWLVDLLRRRFDHRGPVLAEMGRAAYAAFLFHQLVLVGLVLMSRLIPWPPELEYVSVGLLGVGLSFLIGSAVLRVPGVSRFV